MAKQKYNFKVGDKYVATTYGFGTRLTKDVNKALTINGTAQNVKDMLKELREAGFTDVQSFNRTKADEQAKLKSDTMMAKMLGVSVQEYREALSRGIGSTSTSGTGK